MPLHQDDDDIGFLERSRESLYAPGQQELARDPFFMERSRSLPHAWNTEAPSASIPPARHLGPRHVRLAGVFFGFAAAFFFVSLGIAGYLFYSGGNSVSTDKVTIEVQGPTTIAGGDTVPLLITITNRNPTALKDASLEIDFPEGTRDATNVLKAYPRYIEKLGEIRSGETVTRSIKAVVFGGSGELIQLPIIFSYTAAGSNATFEKKDSYALTISTTPLSVSVETLAETVVGEPITFKIIVRSNATVPLNNVVLTATSPFGFSVASSSLPMTNSRFLIGTLAPGSSREVILTGSLVGQNGDKRVFHFSVGTAKSSQDLALAVEYMTQEATVSIAAPFIATQLSFGGNTSDSVVVAPGSTQSVMLTYQNTLMTAITNSVVSISVSGSAVDYDSISTTNGFYSSADHTIIFDQSTDPALAVLAPGASGVGAFTFKTKDPGASAPTITFTTSVSGTRIGQGNVPETVSVSMNKSIKVATAVVFAARATRVSGAFSSTGPIPPRVDRATTYSIVWQVQNKGSAIADGKVTASLPTYVSYTGNTSGDGTFSYDSASHKLSWNAGDLSQGASAQGIFQISITPSISQKGDMPSLTSVASFSGYDRFAGVPVSASAAPVTTELREDPGYVAGSGIVQ